MRPRSRLDIVSDSQLRKDLARLRHIG
jgi:hypothetical protein